MAKQMGDADFLAEHCRQIFRAVRRNWCPIFSTTDIFINQTDLVIRRRSDSVMAARSTRCFAEFGPFMKWA